MLRLLRESEVASITAEIAKLANVPPETVLAVFREFRVIHAAQRHVEELEELDRQKSTFLSVASHELKTPLTSVIAYAELLDDNEGRLDDEQKAEFLHAQAKRQESLENRVRTEMEWLRRGPKARTTKSKARIDNAGELISELADMRSRGRTANAGIDFVAFINIKQMNVFQEFSLAVVR